MEENYTDFLSCFNKYILFQFLHQHQLSPGCNFNCVPAVLTWPNLLHPFIKVLAVEYHRCYNKMQLPKFLWGWGRMRGWFGILALPEEWSLPSSTWICVQENMAISKGICRMSLGLGLLPQGKHTWAHRSCRAEVVGKAWNVVWISGHYCLRKSSLKLEIKSLFPVYQVKHFLGVTREKSTRILYQSRKKYFHSTHHSTHFPFLLQGCQSSVVCL